MVLGVTSHVMAAAAGVLSPAAIVVREIAAVVACALTAVPQRLHSLWILMVPTRPGGKAMFDFIVEFTIKHER